MGPHTHLAPLTVAIVLASAVACSDERAPLPVAGPESVGFSVAPDALLRSYRGRLVLRRVTVIDGTGAPPRSDVDIFIEDGRIASLGAKLEVPEGTIELPVAGHFVTPGLIDGHTHTQSVPGSELRGDPHDTRERQRLNQLRAYLASGVTTVVDMAIARDAYDWLLEKRSAGEPSPEVLPLFPFLTPVDGYMATPELRGETYEGLTQPIGELGDVAKRFDDRPGEAVGAKMVLERGHAFPVFDLFDEATLQEITTVAKARDVPLFVHSMSNDMHRLALTLKPHALVHGSMGAAPLEADVVEAIAASGVYVVSTLGLVEMERWFWHPSAAQADWIRARVPQIQYETLEHRDLRDWGLDAMAGAVKPSYLPGWFVRLIAGWFRDENDSAKDLAESSRGIAALARAGVPLVMGSDAGNWPVFTTMFHGVGSIIELEVLEKAGVDRDEVLIAATSRAAEMVGAASRLGRVAPGFEADLVVLDQNPLDAGMSAFREPVWVISDGEARTPAGWLHGGLVQR